MVPLSSLVACLQTIQVSIDTMTGDVSALIPRKDVELLNERVSLVKLLPLDGLRPGSDLRLPVFLSTC